MTYKVQKGDTLYNIANKYNTTVLELKKINNLTNDILSVGMELIIPISSNQIPEQTINYEVQKGDTLYSIANKYQISVNDIIKANNLTSNILSIGQQLIIPNANNDTPSNNTTVDYIVQKGDTLYNIATKFNTTVAELQKLNNLTTNILSIGQILKVPNQTNTITNYNIEEYNPFTNTLSDYDIELDNMNDIPLSDITESITETNLDLPTTQTTTPQITDNSTSDNTNTTNNNFNNVPNNQIISNSDNNLNTLIETINQDNAQNNRNKEEKYHIKKGDSLWLIAKKYNTTVKNLINYNDLKDINLKINDTLKIPNETRNIHNNIDNKIDKNYYQVQKGDTLWSIASSYNLSFQELKKLNNLETNAVTLGQKLRIHYD